MLPSEIVQAAVCKDGNPVQRLSWGRMVALAQLPEDPYQVKAGVLWVGGHLWRCRTAQDE